MPSSLSKTAFTSTPPTSALVLIPVIKFKLKPPKTENLLNEYFREKGTEISCKVMFPFALLTPFKSKSTNKSL